MAAVQRIGQLLKQSKSGFKREPHFLELDAS